MSRRLSTLLGLLRRAPLLVLPHDNPDPDALAGALGLAELARSLGGSATIGLGGIVGRAENRAMVRELDIPLVPAARLDPKRFPTVALVDTQPGTGNNSLPPGRRADIVIDHHPARAASREASWCDIRETSGVSSAIVLEYLREVGVPVDARLATAFLYAIKSETRDLGRESTPELTRTYLDLFPLADHTKLFAITHPKLARGHFVAMVRALQAAEVRGPLVTANLGELDYPDLVAEVADQLLAYEQARWVLCVGQHRGHVMLSIRTDIADANAGDLIRRILGERGAGGGHDTIAGGRLHAPVGDERALQAVYRELVDSLTEKLDLHAPAKHLLAP